MRFFFFATFLFIFHFCLVSRAQNNPFKGRVIDHFTNLPIQNTHVIFQYIQDNDTTFIGFQFTDSNGLFSFKKDSLDYNHLLIEIHHLNYESLKFSLKNSNITDAAPLLFSLIGKKNELQEVIVYEKKRVAIQGDTTTFYPNGFKMGDEKKLEDLLKILPGMEVNSATGHIKFKGKTVEQIQINGDDLLSSNYALLSKNLSVNLVKSIDAIENFHENPLMREMGQTNKVALNVKLVDHSKSLITEIESNLGYGEKLRQNHAIQVVGLLPKLKFFSSYNANNVGLNQLGVDLSREEKTFTSRFASELLSNNYLSHFYQKPLPEVNQTTENNEKSIGIGSLLNLSKKSQIKYQFNVSSDHFYSKESLIVQSKIDSINIHFKDLNEGNLKPMMAFSNVQFTKQINSNRRLQVDWNYQFLAGTSFEIYKKNESASENNEFNNTLHANALQIEYTEKYKKGIFQLFSNFLSDQKAQTLSILLPNFKSDSLVNSIVSPQELIYNNWKNENKIQYNLPINKLKLTFSISQSQEQYTFGSILTQEKQKVELLSNNFKLGRSQWFQQNKFKWEGEKFKINGLLGLYLTDLNLKEKKEMTKKSFFIQNEFLFSYKINGYSTLLAAFSNKFDLPSELPYFSHNIFTDNRNAKKNLVAIDFVNSKNFLLIYRLDNYLNGINHNFQLNYNIHQNGMYNKINFAGQYFETVSFQKNLTTSQWSGNYQLNKYFLQPYIQIQTNLTYQLGSSFASFDIGGFQEVKTITKGISQKISTKISQKTNLNYELNANWFTTNSTFNAGSNMVFKHSFSLNHTFFELVQTNLAVESILPGKEVGNWYSFVNFKVQHLKDLIKNLKIGFDFKNLLNEKQIEIIENSIYGKSIREVNLIPRIWQVNVLFKI